MNAFITSLSSSSATLLARNSSSFIPSLSATSVSDSFTFKLTPIRPRPASSRLLRRVVSATASPRSASPDSANAKALITDPSKLQPGYAQRVSIDGRELSYDYVEGTGPTLVFLPGYFFSRWKQAKANALEIFAKRKGQSILIEEYLGTGKSGGDFAKDGTLSQWISDTCALIDRLPGHVVLVGAGVGGWIMLHVAMQRRNRVVGLVGINPSVDFTHDLIAPSMTPEQKAILESDGSVNMQWGYCNYPISKSLLTDAEKWLVLQHGGQGSLDIECPVRFLQGLSDEEIPSDRIITLVNVIKSDDCLVTFIKHGDHFLEDETDMRRMWAAVCDVSDSFFEYDLTSPGSG